MSERVTVSDLNFVEMRRNIEIEKRGRNESKEVINKATTFTLARYKSYAGEDDLKKTKDRAIPFLPAVIM